MILIGCILRAAWRRFAKGGRGLSIGLASGTFAATLVMCLISIPAESFRIINGAEPYWFFLDLAMAVREDEGTE